MQSSPEINIESSLIFDIYIYVYIYIYIYITDLQYASNLLDTIMLADDNNLFYAEENIKTFDIVNIELQTISQ